MPYDEVHPLQELRFCDGPVDDHIQGLQVNAEPFLSIAFRDIAGLQPPVDRCLEMPTGIVDLQDLHLKIM